MELVSQTNLRGVNLRVNVFFVSIQCKDFTIIYIVNIDVSIEHLMKIEAFIDNCMI